MQPLPFSVAPQSFPLMSDTPSPNNLPAPDLPPGPDAAAWMEAAHLLRPQGRRGELLAELSCDADLFGPGRSFFLAADQAGPALSTPALALDSSWQPTGRNAGRIVLKLHGTDSISAAEALAGQYLFLRTSDLPALEEGTFRVRDLVGCMLLDGDLLAGTVIDLQFPVAADGRTRLVDAPDLLVLQPVPPTETSSPASDLPEPVLIPFVQAWLLEVDLPGKRIRMNLPAGLLAAEE